MMKSTESLDDAGKSTDLSSATGETAFPSDTAIAENKRRRLVRGAVAFAPLVLTLRSGALAAASCTGVKILSQPTGVNGKFQNDNVVIGDVCVQPGILQSCPAPHADKVLSSSNITAGNTEPVEVTFKTVNNVTTRKVTCGSYSNPQFKNMNVAILSSQSASSMVVAP